MDSESSIMILKLTSNMDYDNQLNRFGESKLENRSISFLNFMCVLRQKLVVLFYKNLGYNNCYSKICMNMPFEKPDRFKMYELV